MDGELSGTTLKESFLRHAKQGPGGKDISSSTVSDPPEKGDGAVDEELNMLTHLLESHASQLGPGPVGNLLNAIGVSLPTVDVLDGGEDSVNDDGSSS